MSARGRPSRSPAPPAASAPSSPIDSPPTAPPSPLTDRRPEKRLDALAADLDLRRPPRRAGRRPARRRRAAEWADRLAERFGAVYSLLHLVGGWRGESPSPPPRWTTTSPPRPARPHPPAHDAAPSATTSPPPNGRFVLISSTQAQKPDGTNASYGAAKAAAESWTLALADDLADTGATANIVVVERHPHPGDAREEPRQGLPDLHPRRGTSPRRIAFLLSDGAAADERASGSRCTMTLSAASPPTTTPAPTRRCSRRSRARTRATPAPTATTRWTARAEDALQAPLRPRRPRLPRLQRHRRQRPLPRRHLRDLAGASSAPTTAHLHVDECGAPERIAGFKLLPVATEHGKLDPAAVEPLLARIGDEHAVQPRVVSISQATELGTVYTPEETARPRRRSPTPSACSSTSTAPASPTPPPRSTSCCATHHRRRRRRHLLRRHQERPPPRRGRRLPPPRARRRLRVPAQAARPARLEDALHLRPARGPARRRPLARATRRTRTRWRPASPPRSAPSTPSRSSTPSRPTASSPAFPPTPPSACSPTMARSSPSTPGPTSRGVVRWMCSWQTTEDGVDRFANAVSGALR